MWPQEPPDDERRRHPRTAAEPPPAVEALVDALLGCGGNLHEAHLAGKAIFRATPTDPARPPCDDFLERPWHWLAWCAADAERVGADALAGKVALACYLWNHVVLAGDPQVQIGALVPAPSSVEVAIYDAGLVALERLPADGVLYADRRGRFSVADALRRLAAEVTALALSTAVPEPTLRLATRIVQGVGP